MQIRLAKRVVAVSSAGLLIGGAVVSAHAGGPGSPDAPGGTLQVSPATTTLQDSSALVQSADLSGAPRELIQRPAGAIKLNALNPHPVCNAWEDTRRVVTTADAGFKAVGTLQVANTGSLAVPLTSGVTTAGSVSSKFDAGSVLDGMDGFLSWIMNLIKSLFPDIPVPGPGPTPGPGPAPGPIPFPTNFPTDLPTDLPTDFPTDGPTDLPTDFPTDLPTDDPFPPAGQHSASAGRSADGTGTQRSLAFGSGESLAEFAVPAGYRGPATYGFRTASVEGTVQYCKLDGTWSATFPTSGTVPVAKDVLLGTRSAPRSATLRAEGKLGQG